MDSTTIELKVTYGKDLKVSNYFQKPVVYVQVSIGSYDPDEELEENLQQVQRTATVREEDGHPEWNQEMLFELTDAMVVDPAHFFLQFDLKHEGRVFGEKPIGDVRVPFLDLFEGSDGIVRYVSYEVRTIDRKPNGSLNFSYRVNFKGGDLGIGMNLPGNVTEYPVGDYGHFSRPDPVQAYPGAPGVNVVAAYPITHEVGCLSLDPDPVQVYPPPSVHVVAYPIAHESGNLLSDPDPVQVYPPPSDDSDPVQVYPPLSVDVGCLSSDPDPVQVYPHLSVAYPIAHEVGRLSPDPVQLYPPLSVDVVAYPTGHEAGLPLSLPYPPPLNDCFPSPPTMVHENAPPEAVAVDHHHHHHHVPSPTQQWALDPHEYSSGYEHIPKEWTTDVRSSSPWTRR